MTPGATVQLSLLLVVEAAAALWERRRRRRLERKYAELLELFSRRARDELRRAEAD